ncbi:MAG: DUF3134 domain-containing protein [Elainellaceae cyanobacterium]
MQNPALHEYPRRKPSPIIPQPTETSILDWLEASNRLLAREESDFDYSDDEAEINELMSGENNAGYEDDSDDDDDDSLELEN